VIVPLVLFFLLAEGRSIKRSLIEIIPNQYFEMVLNLLHRIDQQLGGYIRGMVMSVMLISALSILGLRLIGLNDYLVVGTIAGVSNIIPYLGPLIGIMAGTIAAVLQYSTLGWWTILPVIFVFLTVQLLDNVFVQPVVVARSVNLHPLIVIFVVLFGSHMFGAVGMLLAVPLTAVIKVSVRTVYESLITR
jgi:predicted PurR-regulated permease PerM